MELPNHILIPYVAQVLREGHTATLPLRGHSMRPYLEDGRDKAILTLPPPELKRGDIILATIAPQRYALHRVTSIDGDNITMHGDGNFSPEHITRADVIALATHFYRKHRSKPEPVAGMKQQLYWRLWLALRPARRLLLIIWRFKHYPKETTIKAYRKITHRQ